MKKFKQNKLQELKERINLNVFGVENSISEDPIVFIANHNCLMDIFYVPVSLQNMCISLISPRLIYKRDVKRQNMVKRYLYSMPIEAHGGAKYVEICLNQAEKILRSNIDVVIFPEGAYIEPSNYIYRGRTGAARILYNAREKGLKPKFVPIAIEIISDKLNLDNFTPCEDIVNIYFLPYIDYEEYYQEYLIAKSRNKFDKANSALHRVVDEGMKSIASKLGKEYLNQYITLRPKNNVMFSNGEIVEQEKAQSDYYINLYKKELDERLTRILNIY